MINEMKFKVLLRLKMHGIYVSVIGLGNFTSTISLGLVIGFKIKRKAFSQSELFKTRNLCQIVVYYLILRSKLFVHLKFCKFS